MQVVHQRWLKSGGMAPILWCFTLEQCVNSFLKLSSSGFLIQLLYNRQPNGVCSLLHLVSALRFRSEVEKYEISLTVEMNCLSLQLQLWWCVLIWGASICTSSLWPFSLMVPIPQHPRHDGQALRSTTTLVLKSPSRSRSSWYLADGAVEIAVELDFPLWVWQLSVSEHKQMWCSAFLRCLKGKGGEFSQNCLSGAPLQWARSSCFSLGLFLCQKPLIANLVSCKAEMLMFSLLDLLRLFCGIHQSINLLKVVLQARSHGTLHYTTLTPEAVHRTVGLINQLIY